VKSENYRETATQALTYLLNIGALGQQDFKEEDITVSFKESRNAVCLIQTSAAMGFICKAGIQEPWNTEPKVAAEARFYKYAWHDSRFAELRAFLPRFLNYDSRSYYLIIDACLPEITLHEAWAGDAAVETSFLSFLGAALKNIKSVGMKFRTGGALQKIDSSQPWILNLATGHGLPIPNNEIATKILAVARNSQALVAAAGALKASWNNADLIHGDMRLSNILIAKKPEILKIVDWELFGWGDSCWDAGSLFGSMICASCAYSSDPPRFQQIVGEIAGLFRTIFENYSPSKTANEDDVPVRIVLYAGLRLVQCAFEHAQVSGAAPEKCLFLVSVAVGMCTNQAWVAQQFNVAGH
jgi:hypothetical protein